MTAYYNEIDPFAAAWLRQLISAGHIAPGDVDERSIVDVRPDDLRKYNQCHFFAGIGVWSYALRRAGWPDDRPIWTGSCPCQPFSAAGKGGGFDDERHLWPSFFHLIGECGPPVVAGEQVASKDGLAWLDLVQADMEGTGYAFGAVDTCAAGFGAPHIRQRLYWLGRMADADGAGQYAHVRSEQDNPIENLWGGASGGLELDMAGRNEGQSGGMAGALPLELVGLAYPYNAEWGSDDPRWYYGSGAYARWKEETGDNEGCCDVGLLAHSAEFGWLGRRANEAGVEPRTQQRFDGLRATGGTANDLGSGLEGSNARSVGKQREAAKRDGGGESAHQPATGPTNGLWGAADWLFCRDGKWRPVEPGTFPLAHGAAARVGRLRGYGNAINAEQATAFITAYLETEADQRVRLTGAFA